MTRVTRFAGRDPGPAARVAGFITHLRSNGLSLGVAETALALDALTHVNAAIMKPAVLDLLPRQTGGKAKRKATAKASLSRLRRAI